MSDHEHGSFADYPESLAEVRSGKDKDGAKWSPRDALIATLRKLDRGEIKPECLIVCWAAGSDGDGWEVGLHASSPNYLLAMGTLDDAKSFIAHKVRETGS